MMHAVFFQNDSFITNKVEKEKKSNSEVRGIFVEVYMVIYTTLFCRHHLFCLSQHLNLFLSLLLTLYLHPEKEK